MSLKKTCLELVTLPKTLTLYFWDLGDHYFMLFFFSSMHDFRIGDSVLVHLSDLLIVVNNVNDAN